MNVQIQILKADITADLAAIAEIYQALKRAGTELHEVQRILVEDGLVLVRVPNMVFHEALRPFFGAFSMLKVRKPGYLGGVAPPQHLYGFTPQALCSMLNQADFDVLAVEPAPLRNLQKSFGLAAARIVATVLAHVVYRGSFGKLVLSPTMIAFAAKRR